MSDPAAPGVPEVVPGEEPAPRAHLEWRRVHPVTPVVKGWKAIAVIIFVLAQQIGPGVSDLWRLLAELGWIGIAGGIAVVVLGIAVWAVVSWRLTRYAVAPDALYLHTGVFVRQQRSARLDRVQAVDVVQPLLARLLGLAELRFEVAGGSDSSLTLSYLREEAAQRLRNEILARSAGVEVGSEPEVVVPEAPARELLHVPAGRLVASLVRSGPVLGMALGLVGVVVAAAVTRGPGPILTLLPMSLGAAGYLWGRFGGEFDFRVAQAADGIRLRHGLTEQRSQTVPPGRVQAVRLIQGPLWRGRDWWRVEINVAGYGVSDGRRTETVLLPVGGRDEALTALWLVVPDLGVADPLPLLDELLSGPGATSELVGAPRRARVLDPVSWQQTGVATTSRAVLVRTGRFVRRVVVVPHERTQSLGLTQGPLQRRLGLASVVLHSTPGPVRPQVPHLDARTAGALLVEQAERARAARRAAGPERWMRAEPAR